MRPHELHLCQRAVELLRRLIAAVAPFPLRGQIPYATNATNNPLVALNNLFHDQYTAVGRRMIPSDLVVLEDDYLVRLRRQPTLHGSPGTFVRTDKAVVCPPVSDRRVFRATPVP